MYRSNNDAEIIRNDNEDGVVIAHAYSVEDAIAIVAELSQLRTRVKDLENQISDMNGEENEMCEAMNKVLDEYHIDWDDDHNTYAASFKNALSQLRSELERVQSKLTASEAARRVLVELVLEAHREKGNGFDMLASATWDRIVEEANSLKLLEGEG